jgi:trk system potassium uptake protein TrkH
MPFALFVLAVRGKPMALLTDPQPRLFLAIVLGASALVLAYVSALGLDVSRPGEPAVVVVIFNMVSVMTGTGYATSDFGLWGPFTYWVVLLLTVFGGCGGSAAGGMKMFRLHIATSAAFARYARIAHPRRVIPVRYNGRVISDEDVKSITVFISLFLMTLVVGALGYMLLGYDTLTAVSASATAVSNVGPGLGPEIGPATTFQSFSDAATAWTTLLMFMGRLELLAVLVLVTPRFWRD